MFAIPDNFIRKTQSMCSELGVKVDAYLVEENGKIIMRKSCPEHGQEELVVSRHPWYYKELTEYYFKVMPNKMKQRRFYIYLSNICNLNCPVCLLEPNQNKITDIRLDDFKQIIEKNKDCRFYLYGAEPTLRPDLKQWIELLRYYGNLVNVHTNAIKLADYDYACKLKSWGVDYVSMQFDGFDDRVYEILRGKKLLDLKLKALENLKRLDIATGFNVTIAKDINEDQIHLILDYALANNFVKDVSFATLSFLGDAKGNFSSEATLMPDELIDIVECQTKGKIKRENIFLFQKLYYTLLAVFKVRRCYNFQHLVLYRKDNSAYMTLDQLFDLKRLEPVFSRYVKLVKKSRLLASVYFLGSFFLNFFGKNFLKRLRCIPPGILIPWKIRNIKIPSKTLFISFGTVCDNYKFDSHINDYCGQGFCFAGKDKIKMTDSVPDFTMSSKKEVCK
ncbi:MAG: radical SAM protein [Candidatus Omnitrophica bacterium]|nr:radical SAM protein [Candidatus Omnitrophota bacterium]